MAVVTTTTRGGPAAFDALAAAVRRLKAGDPLRPVAILVPTNTAGVMARRALGRRGGALAIDVVTMFRLAELAGAARLRGGHHEPVSTPVVDLAVRAVLAGHPGRYAPVADHPSTITALRDLYRAVRSAGPGSLTALAQTERGAEPARVITATHARLGDDFYDEGDLAAAAIAAIDDGEAPRFERAIVFLPGRLGPAEHRLIEALGRAGHVEVVRLAAFDATGRLEPADGALPARGDASSPADAGTAAAGPSDILVAETTDADDEVRLAVRHLLARARAGDRFDRMALLWPSDRPYARIVEHHLHAADIPWNGRPGTTTMERAVPRVLTELLDIDRRGLRRRAVIDLVSEFPPRLADGRRAPAARWERAARAAGVSRPEDWDVRLGDAIRQADDRLRELDDDPDERAFAARRAEQDRDDAQGLLDFVHDLQARLGDRDTARPWAEWAGWATDTLAWWFGSDRLEQLPDADRAAYEQTQRILSRLAQLDRVEPSATRRAFHDAVVAEFDTAPPRQGTIGDGVSIGTLAGAVGLDVDVVVILGAADGVLPPRPAPDPLLAEIDRQRAGLPTAAEWVDHLRQTFLHLVDATPDVMVTVPRGDLRTTAAHSPTRWLAEYRSSNTRAERVECFDSHTHSLSITTFPVSEAEHRRRALWTTMRAGGDVAVHPLVAADDPLARAIRLRLARASDRFTEYDGNLASRPIAPIGVESPISPTRLEDWVKCPHAYFVKNVLGVRRIEDPDEALQITPLDRGSVLHDILDQLNREVLDGTLPLPAEGWTDEHCGRLLEIAQTELDALAGRGRTGRRAYWHTDRQSTLADVVNRLGHDCQSWMGRRIVGSEQAFGTDEVVELVLTDGRRIKFRGSIDRTDELPDGTLTVIDHKTGKHEKFTAITQSTPTAGGSRFQLPIYALATRTLHARPDAAVRAEYSFFRAGDYRSIGVDVDDVVLAETADHVARIVGGIAAGMFTPIPATPGFRMWPDCDVCEALSLGPGPAWPQWLAKRHDPAITAWLPAPDGDGDDTAGDPPATDRTGRDVASDDDGTPAS